MRTGGISAPFLLLSSSSIFEKSGSPLKRTELDRLLKEYYLTGGKAVIIPPAMMTEHYKNIKGELKTRQVTQEDINNPRTMSTSRAHSSFNRKEVANIASQSTKKLLSSSDYRRIRSSHKKDSTSWQNYTKSPGLTTWTEKLYQNTTIHYSTISTTKKDSSHLHI